MRTQRLEVLLFEVPGRVRLLERLDLLGRPARGQYAGAQGERGRSPLAERADVRRAALGEHVAGEVIAPGKQRHLELELRPGRARADDDVVGRAILEASRENHFERGAQIAEPEIRGVEKMRYEVGQHSGAGVAPCRIAHQAGGAVAVE